jgi:hypothetical protein
MRLPLRHPPPGVDAPLRRCAYLEALAEASLGLCLAPAAALVATPTARGRIGNALQWHFGLDPHDSSEQLDWEDAVEIKLVSVWQRGGRIGCDKLKVCDLTADPWRKLGNVLWVFADRMTRVIVGHKFWRLAGAGRTSLAAAWHADPHFEQPTLFVESREQDDRTARRRAAIRQAPAYYLSAAWLAANLLTTAMPGVYPFDARWWSTARDHGTRRRDPALALWRGESAVRCPRCGGPLHVDLARVKADRWAPATHAMPIGPDCGLRAHAVLDVDGLVLAPSALGRDELEVAIEGRAAPDQVPRLADGVIEPEDHEHA